MSNTEGFSERLRTKRAELGLTQGELSIKSGVSVPQISRYELGQAIPRAEIAMKLARALGVSATWLLIDNQKEDAPPRVMGFDRESMDNNSMTLHFSSDATEKLKAIADHRGRDVYLTAMNLIYDAIDNEYKKISK